METEKKLDGAFLGLAVIIIILIVGGVYIWQSRIKQIELQKAQNTAITAEDTTNLNTLEQNLNTVNTNVGVDVNKIK